MDTIQVGNKTYEYTTFREWHDLKVIEVTDLPVKGVSCLWDDSGEYRIFINEGLSDREKLEVFVHEMIHLYHDDHNNHGEDLQEVEARTHKATEDILKKLQY